MKFPVYSIRDIHVGFMAPRVESNDYTARRSFAFEINNRDGIMNFSAKDFDLYKIGEFEQETGKFEPCIPELVVSGINVLGAGE